jgi:hypothetical protein
MVNASKNVQNSHYIKCNHLGKWLGIKSTVRMGLKLA